MTTKQVEFTADELLMDHTFADELVPVQGVISQAQDFDKLGQRYDLFIHTGGDHLAFSVEDRFGDALTVPADELALRAPIRPPRLTQRFSPLFAQGSAAVGFEIAEHFGRIRQPCQRCSRWAGCVLHCLPIVARDVGGAAAEWGSEHRTCRRTERIVLESVRPATTRTEIEERIHVDLIVENSDTASYHKVVSGGRLVREADSWRDIVLIRRKNVVKPIPLDA